MVFLDQNQGKRLPVDRDKHQEIALILDNIRILGKKTAKNWTILRVLVRDDQLKNFAKLVQANLLTENKVNNYDHFYNHKDMIANYQKKIIQLKPAKKNRSSLARCHKASGITQ